MRYFTDTLPAAQLKNASLEIAALTALLLNSDRAAVVVAFSTCACKDAVSPTPSTRRGSKHHRTPQTLLQMPDAEAIRRRFDRINYEEPKTAEDHPFVAACLLFVFVFFFVSVLSTFLNSSAQYQKELAAAEARKKAKKDD